MASRVFGNWDLSSMLRKHCPMKLGDRLLLCKPIKASTLIHISNELTRSSVVGSGLLDHQCLEPPNCHLTWYCLAGPGLTILSWVWKRWKPCKKTGYELWPETRQNPFQCASLTHSVMGIGSSLNIKGAFGSYVHGLILYSCIM
jgi:hypothetical protein